MTDDDFLIRSKLLAAHGITGLFTTRNGGVSEKPFDTLNFGTGLGDSDDRIAINMSRLCSATSLPSPHQARQVHGRDTFWCHGEGRFHDRDADALLSNQAGTAVAVRTADCLPILLADPAHGIIAAVHAGWRGTVANVLAAAIRSMVSEGAKPEAILASLGPCIGACCFSIDPDTAAQLAACSAGAPTHVQCEAGKCTADLAAINRDQLLVEGVRSDHIEWLSSCTSCHPETFYSHRRDQGVTGRQLAVVALPAST